MTKTNVPPTPVHHLPTPPSPAMIYTVLALAMLVAGAAIGIALITAVRRRLQHETPLSWAVATIVILGVAFSVLFGQAQRLQFERFVVCSSQVSRADRANLRGTLIELLSRPGSPAHVSPPVALRQLINETKTVDSQGNQCQQLTETGPLGPG